MRMYWLQTKGPYDPDLWTDSESIERGLLWRVQKAYSSTEIPARNSTQISHECADLCMHIIIRARSTNGDYISTSGIVNKINGRPNINVSFASMKN